MVWMTARCFDDGVCHFVQLGHPRCKGLCSIAVSRREDLWKNILMAAERGWHMAAKIVRRVEIS